MNLEIVDFDTLKKQFKSDNLEERQKALRNMFILYGLSAHAFYIQALKDDETIAKEALNYLQCLGGICSLNVYLALLLGNEVKDNIKIDIIENLAKLLTHKHFKDPLKHYKNSHSRLMEILEPVLSIENSFLSSKLLDLFVETCKMYFEKNNVFEDFILEEDLFYKLLFLII